MLMSLKEQEYTSPPQTYMLNAQPHSLSFTINTHYLSAFLSVTETETRTEALNKHSPLSTSQSLTSSLPGKVFLKMDNKSDVKAIMARFQAGGGSTDETSSAPPGRIKQPLHPTLSSGPPIQKKPVLESLSGSAVNTPPKPSFLKNTVSTKSDTEVQEPNKAKALASRFANIQDDSNMNSKPFTVNKQQTPLKSPLSQAPEVKSLAQKPPFNKPPLTSTVSESKPAFPKPSPAISNKPSWVKDENNAAPNSSPAPLKLPGVQQKPIGGIVKLRQQAEEQAGGNKDNVIKPSSLANSSSKPTSNFRTAQNLFNKEEKTEQTESGGTSKPGLTATNSIPPPKPPASKKPSFKKPVKPSPLASGGVNGNDSSGPKRNPLPNSLALGPPPAKPNRPPKVNLENIKRGSEASDEGPSFKKPIAASNHVAQNQAPPPALPNLPPRHPGAMNQQEDTYDDVDHVTNSPPPLPPSAAHPSQRGKEEINDDDDDDGEMYEDLDERWEAAEQKQEKKKEKEDKEEKKRQEAEKKEQKEREKKEQEARKRFKLVGPLEVLQKGKASTDCRSSKTDLGLKQGDPVDIIRVQGNPEGKWLGRAQDGSIGYVKTTSVEIDFNSLKNQGASLQQAYEPEVYDDIDVVDNSTKKGPGVVLPPLPGGEEGEIYDDVVDPNLEVRVPPPSQFTADGNSDKPGQAIDEEIYDDVDSQNAPIPPPISSIPPGKIKTKVDEMDPKKQKKFEKEEKEFRKKFKYEGEIQVLYQVNVIHNLTNKKWSGKELPVKAGEALDVIAKAVDNKLICRNEDGKFGYVSTSHIAMDDGDIYDDIGDECIYDND
ncbi:FYN-binding protein 1 isoform X2 [Haplochromis burtoni]|uniref:FYN-binding protein 1 isoform X2 n=1 Tax=Haplochromis burtoni TaxID=8153 RepID=UPI0003BDA7F8|nr:FYN-binding protein 1 isoform X2 [Haplochromis burtoni]